MVLKRIRKSQDRKTRARRSPSLSQLKRRAWKLLSELVRRSATKDGNGVAWCYTCPTIKAWSQLQAGHAIPGRTGATLLDEEIIRPQCERCNIWLRGNYQVFIPKLIHERGPYGMDWWQQKLSESRSVVKWTRSDLEAKIQDYKSRLQALDRWTSARCAKQTDYYKQKPNNSCND